MGLVTLSFLFPLTLSGCDLFGAVPGDSDKTDGGGGGDTGDTGTSSGKDHDGDGYKNDADCDDQDPDVYEGAPELCDEKDNDCNGKVDDGANDGNTYWTDDDGDGYGTGDSYTACAEPDDAATQDGDCDDSNRRVFPGAEEVCNGVDDDCDGKVDNNPTDASDWYDDKDGDGFGDGRNSTTSCDQPEGTVENGDDCDDRDGDVHPGADELCNEVDDDCDDLVDEGASGTTYYDDADGDGFGDPRSGTESCDAPIGSVTNADDCDDRDADVSPDGTEVCDGTDNDCDGNVDNGAIDADYLYLDGDSDGFGDPLSYDLRCSGVDNGDDCDDADPTEPQVVDAGASGVPDGSLSAPWTSIQDGIDAADVCVLAFAGVYEETINFSGKDILVKGVDGADSTVIDARGAGAVVTFNNGEGAGAELIGFTLSNGSGYEDETTTSRSCGSSTTCTDHYTMICGGGVYVDGSEPTLRSLILRQNIVEAPADSSSGNDFYYYFSFGGGLCVRNADLFVDSLKLEQNAADDGGGLYVESGASLELKHSTLYSNTAENGAGAMVDGGSFTASNVILAWNSASNSGGGVLGIDATVALENVTVGECDAPAESGGGVNANGTTSLTLLNTILYGSEAGYGVVVDATARFSGSYSDVYGNVTDDYSGITDPTGTSGNISSDPSFASVTDDGDYTNDDWSLASGSACKNAGNPAAAYNDADGTRNDVGAYGGSEGAW